MAPDNRTTCPNCQKLAKEKWAELQEKSIQEAREGTQESFQEVVTEMRKINLDLAGDHQLGEWKEVFMRKDGVLVISYGCNCDECGWSYDVQDEIDAFGGE
jgi:hypothetical protein